MGNTLNEENQIEEIAKILNGVCLIGECSECEYYTLKHEEYACCDIKTAKAIYNAGYRKSTDIAREIFEEIEKMLISNHIESYMTLDDTWIHRFKNSILINLNELRKKYTESEDTE